MSTIGDREYMRLRDKIQMGDLDVKNSAGFIVYTSFGTLISFRAELERRFGRELIYFTISGTPLYLVHWNDLCEKKRMDIERRKNENVKNRLPRGT